MSRYSLVLRTMNRAAREIFQESIQIKEAFLESHLDSVVQCAELLIKALKSGNKILCFGNGGSAADAQHFAAEMMNRMLIERSPLPAIALTTDTSILTSISNDYEFEKIFTKQIQALGMSGDIALGITTSGNSPNIISALEMANKQGMCSIALSGNNGGKVADIAKHCIIVPSTIVPRIQEVHECILHCLCELIDQALFGKSR